MLLLYYLGLKKTYLLAVSYVLQVVPYFLLMKKLGLKPWFALLPNLAEYKMSRKVFPKRRTFFRPFILSILLLAFALYVHPNKGVGILYTLAVFVIWGVFLARLYSKVCKAFCKKKIFAFGAIILPPVLLTLLGSGKAEFTAPEFPEPKPCSKAWKITKRVGFVLISIAEIAVIIAGCGFLAIKQRIPGIIVSWHLDDVEETAKNVGPTGDIVTRDDILGTSLSAIEASTRTRDYYCADHSNDESVIVYAYIIGANLENDSGSASTNIRQMINATEQGSGLKFVLETGGCERWFTNGIKNSSVGRYEIANGKLEKVVELPSDTNMTDPQTLTDFLTWAKETYNADRNFLLLWDHGGGVCLGFGQDDLNGVDSDTLEVFQIADAIGQAGMMFDMIGFDACLMQDIEAAVAMAPYADYYIASEESEPSTGWFYTDAFGALAKNPGMSSEDFAKELIATYDPYTTVAYSDGEVDPTATLSVIDLTVAEGACEQLSEFMDDAADKITVDPECFADFSAAAANTYDFSGYQLDLIDFLQILNSMDYDEAIATSEEMDELIQAIQASVVCRNGASAEGINGVAFAMPYNAMGYYDSTSTNLKALSMDGEKHVFDVVFSIIAAQKMKAGASVLDDMGDMGSLLSLLGDLMPESDYSDREWYIAGFENYDDTDQFVDIPLIEKENGWQVDLPEKTWKIVTDVQTMVYQQVENDPDGAVLRYIGNDYIGDEDENGNTLIAPDDCWPHINGQLVCYQSDKVKITNDGAIYGGTIEAMLNSSTPIRIHIQWDDEIEGQTMTARVLGYEYVDSEEDSDMPEKGYHELQAGDSIQFMFDYYDAEGNLVATRTDGSSIRVISQDRLKVTDDPLTTCSIEFGGLLTDVYQRLITTEMITMDIQ